MQLNKFFLLASFLNWQDREVIHSSKNLFWNVGHNCNLAIEFNGLVSKRVNRKVGPFYILNTAVISVNPDLYFQAFYLVLLLFLSFYLFIDPETE